MEQDHGITTFCQTHARLIAAVRVLHRSENGSELLLLATARAQPQYTDELDSCRDALSVLSCGAWPDGRRTIAGTSRPRRVRGSRGRPGRLDVQGLHDRSAVAGRPVRQ